MRNTEALERVTSQYAMIEEGARALVEQRNNARKYNADFIPLLIERLKAYSEECEHENKPMTMAGFILASGVPQSTFYEMSNGDYDHVIEEYKIIHGIEPTATEYIDEDGVIIPLVPFSEVIQKNARLPLQNQLESNCYTQQRGVNPAGSIFGLKSVFGFTEDSQPARVTNNLVIADGEQARRALEMLTR